MRDVKYWPVFRFSPSLEDFEMLAIFTTKDEAEAYASSIDGNRTDRDRRAVTADFDWERIREHIVSNWLTGYLKRGIKLVLEPADEESGAAVLYAGSPFPIAVAKKA